MENKTAMVSQKTDSQKEPLVRPYDLLKKIQIRPQVLVVFNPFDWILFLKGLTLYRRYGGISRFVLCRQSWSTINPLPLLDRR
jgi:hypothetical protein